MSQSTLTIFVYASFTGSVSLFTSPTLEPVKYSTPETKSIQAKKICLFHSPVNLPSALLIPSGSFLRKPSPNSDRPLIIPPLLIFLSSTPSPNPSSSIVVTSESGSSIVRTGNEEATYIIATLVPVGPGNIMAVPDNFSNDGTIRNNVSVLIEFLQSSAPNAVQVKTALANLITF